MVGGVVSALASPGVHEAQRFPIPCGRCRRAVHGEEGSIVRLKIISELWIELAYDAERLRIPRLVGRLFGHEGQGLITLTTPDCLCKQGKAFIQ